MSFLTTDRNCRYSLPYLSCIAAINLNMEIISLIWIFCNDLYMLNFQSGAHFTKTWVGLEFIVCIRSRTLDVVQQVTESSLAVCLKHFCASFTTISLTSIIKFYFRGSIHNSCNFEYFYNVMMHYNAVIFVINFPTRFSYKSRACTLVEILLNWSH